MLNSILAAASILSGSRARKRAEAMEFVAFLRDLVETASEELADTFGNLAVTVVQRNGVDWPVGIVLTATDYIWWRKQVEEEGVLFKEPLAKLKMRMLERVAEKAEQSGLSTNERAKLLDILDKALSARIEGEAQ